MVRVLIVAAVGVAGVLLYRSLREYSLDELLASLRSFPLARLGLAAAFAALSYLCLTGFDMLALRYVGRPLPYPKAAIASFTSLSIGHNVGVSALSSGAIRYRFYSRWGLSLADVAKLIVFCGVTVGLGITLLGGITTLANPGLAQKTTGLSLPVVIALGSVCLAVCAGYLALAAWRTKPFRFRKWSFEFPSPQLAAAQLVVGALNFACVAACLHQALAATVEVGYLQTATVYVLANASWLMSHVPGGLGVLESVILVLLPQGKIISALLVFRFVYFLAPLALGLATLLLSELLIRGRKDAGARSANSAAA
jgi:glycosyltransferase 2 family protein